jgi:putative tricarboxylic transport membrane protein
MTTAALNGGLMIHCLQPGPIFIGEYWLVGPSCWCTCLPNIASILTRPDHQAIRQAVVHPKYILFPAIFICCDMGTIALTTVVFDVGFCLAQALRDMR